MEITDRRNTLKTRAFKSDASRPEKFEENATEPFTPFLMYYTPIALTTLSPEKITMPFTVFCLGQNSPLTSSALFHTLERLLPLYRLLLPSGLMLTAAI